METNEGRTEVENSFRGERYSVKKVIRKCRSSSSSSSSSRSVKEWIKRDLPQHVTVKGSAFTSRLVVKSAVGVSNTTVLNIPLLSF